MHTSNILITKTDATKAGAKQDCFSVSRRQTARELDTQARFLLI